MDVKDEYKARAQAAEASKALVHQLCALIRAGESPATVDGLLKLMQRLGLLTENRWSIVKKTLGEWSQPYLEERRGRTEAAAKFLNELLIKADTVAEEARREYEAVA